MKDPITKAPKEWLDFCSGFHQDFGFRGIPFEDELKEMLSGMGAEKLSIVKRYIEGLTVSGLTEGQIGKLFAKGGAQIIVASREKQPMRTFLRQILKMAEDY